MRRLAITVDGKQVASEPYLSEMRATNVSLASRPDVEVAFSVIFALPTTGGGTVAVRSYRNSRDRHDASIHVVTAAAFTAQLLQAYGPPSRDNTVALDAPDQSMRGVVGLQWLFSRTARLPCPVPACRIDGSEIELASMANYEEAISHGGDVRIAADGYPLETNSTELTITEVVVEDAATRALSLREAVRQLTEAASATPAATGKQP